MISDTVGGTFAEYVAVPPPAPTASPAAPTTVAADWRAGAAPMLDITGDR
jgi:hypothetical protein